MPIQNDDDFWVNRLDKIESKQDKIIDSQTALLVKVSKNTQVLIDHQRRSLANEKQVEVMTEFTKTALAELRSEIKPLAAAHSAVALGAKWVGFLAMLTGFGFTLAKIFGMAI